jgi:hypothetical protein
MLVVIHASLGWIICGSIDYTHKCHSNRSSSGGIHVIEALPQKDRPDDGEVEQSLGGFQRWLRMIC